MEFERRNTYNLAEIFGRRQAVDFRGKTRSRSVVARAVNPILCLNGDNGLASVPLRRAKRIVEGSEVYPKRVPHRIPARRIGLEARGIFTLAKA